MGKNKLYEYLIMHTEDLCQKYNYNLLYSFGKALPFDERVTYDYKIRCIKNNKDYSCTLALFNNKDSFISELILHDELDYILKNISSIIKSYGDIKKYLLKYLESKKDVIPEDKYKEIIKCIIINIFKDSKISDNDVSTMVNEMYNSKINVFNIEHFTRGGYSEIYKAEDKIIKVGVTRETKKIVLNRRILLPDYIGKIGRNIVEITDFIEDNNNIKYEDIHEVYQELRNQGLIWLDPSYNNVRRLNKDNVEKINKKRNKISSDFFINDERCSKEPLKEGDLVIIDLDHILYEDDLTNINRIKNNLSYESYQIFDHHEKGYVYKKSLRE